MKLNKKVSHKLNLYLWNYFQPLPEHLGDDNKVGIHKIVDDTIDNVHLGIGTSEFAVLWATDLISNRIHSKLMNPKSKLYIRGLNCETHTNTKAKREGYYYILATKKEQTRIKEIRFKEILTNLVDNAIKFTEQGYVKVKARKQDDSVLIEVIDTGIGIAEDKKSRIFEEFYQISTPLKSEVGGTGLGLSITKQMVELLGGKINFKSELGKGSTFYFTLPVNGIASKNSK
jgi:signal transduction histidine kinase